MNKTSRKVKKAAGTGFRADFKTAASKRKIRFASGKEVEKLTKPIHKEFARAFDILAQ